MCILFIAVKQHPDYPLIIAANRDEFRVRPTAVSRFWPDAPNVLAGRDLEAGGSWMGVTRNGRIAALTNIRDPSRQISHAKSRGQLVTSFLQQDNCVLPEQFGQTLVTQQHQYNGYNLVFGQADNLYTFHSNHNTFLPLQEGCHGLSNAELNTQWPKVTKGVQQLEQYCRHHYDIKSDDLFSLLQDNTQAQNSALPNTGVPQTWEKRLSSIFIEGEDYGTRSSTILLINKHRQIFWKELTYDAQGNITNDVEEKWKIPANFT